MGSVYSWEMAARAAGRAGAADLGVWDWPFARAPSDINWYELTAQASAFGDTNAVGYEARITGLPTGGGVTISPGQSISAALASSDVVFLNSGTYNLTPPLTIGTNKKLICKSGVATLNFTSYVAGGNMIVMTGNNAVLAGVGDGVIAVTATTLQYNGIVIFGGATNNTIYHVAVDNLVFDGGGSGISAFLNAINTLICSCSVDRMTDNGTGGNADGFSGATNTTALARNGWVDCHADRCSDDGFDVWDTTQPQFFYYCKAKRQGKHPIGPNGDGNGFKLGRSIPGVVHYLYKCDASDNKAYGYNRNGNGYDGSNYLPQYAPVLKACTALVANGFGTYADGSSVFNIQADDTPPSYSQASGAVLPGWEPGVYATGSTVALDFGVPVGAVTSYTYQVLRDGVAVPGASGAGVTSATYTFVAADVDHILSFSVIAHNGAAASGTAYAAGVPVSVGPTILLAGDSTVTAASGWGTGFAARTVSPAVVDNQADSGESARSYKNCFWSAAIATRPTHVLIQFGHNDSFSVANDCLGQAVQTTEAEYGVALTYMVDDARSKGALPILVTPLHPRDNGNSSLESYAVEMRARAAALGVLLLDLHAISLAYNISIGQSATNALYSDTVHLNASGSTQYGGMVATELATLVPALDPFLT